MNKITVRLKDKYDIFVGANLIKDTGKMIRDITNAKKAVVITDSNVNELYGSIICDSLEKSGFTAYCFVFPAGEESKNLNTAVKAFEFLAEQHISRTDIVVALGGGVTGDLAGFVAANYLRGIKFVQIPTSLLAQIDSSVGGKTGVDLSGGKNLVGAFWQPSLVICDTDVLKTLNEKLFNDGIAEGIKYGLIKDKKMFFRLLNDNIYDFLEEFICSCISIKAQIVERDEFDTGERMLLNFGHTLGHAIEKISNFTISHGEAVAIGMAIITASSERLSLTKAGTYSIVCDCLKKYNLKTTTDIPLDDILSTCLSDKKILNEFINLIIVKDIGNGIIHKLGIDKLNDFFKVRG